MKKKSSVNTLDFFMSQKRDSDFVTLLIEHKEVVKRWKKNF